MITLKVEAEIFFSLRISFSHRPTVKIFFIHFCYYRKSKRKCKRKSLKRHVQSNLQYELIHYFCTLVVKYWNGTQTVNILKSPFQYCVAKIFYFKCQCWKLFRTISNFICFVLSWNQMHAHVQSCMFKIIYFTKWRWCNFLREMSTESATWGIF